MREGITAEQLAAALIRNRALMLDLAGTIRNIQLPANWQGRDAENIRALASIFAAANNQEPHT
jgi:hypothetical protein